MSAHSRLRHLLVAVLSTLLVTAGLLATAQAPAAALETGTVTGVVTDSAGNPLSSVRVYAADTTGTYASEDYTYDGTYELSLVAGYQYKIFFEDYYDSHLDEYWNDKLTWAQATPVSVTTGQVLSGIDASLADPAKITGLVTDSVSGAGIPGADVSALVYDAESDDWFGAGGTQTEADGSYEIGRLEEGTYRIRVNGFDAEYGTVETTTDLVVARSATVTQHVQMAKPGVVKGAVTSSLGQALAGVEVTVSKYVDDDGGYWTYVLNTWTNASGQYRMSRIPPGATYRVKFTGSNGYLTEYWPNQRAEADAQTFTVGVGEEAVRDAQLEKGGVVTGTVTGQAGYSLNQTTVQLFQVDGATSTLIRSNGGGAAFNFGGLMPGSYRLKMLAGSSSPYLTEWWQDSPTEAGSTPMHVGIDGVVAVDPQVELGGIVGGTVTTAGGAPLSGVTVRAYRVEEGAGFLEKSVATQSNGTFLFTGLPANTYRLKYEKSGYQTRWNGGVGEFYEAADVPVPGGGAAVPDQNLVMGTAGAMSGQVVDAAGNGVPSQVSLYRYVPSRDDWSSITLHLVGASGQWSSTGLEPGIYRIRVNPDGQNFTEEYWRDARDFGTSDNIYVGSGQVRSGITTILGQAAHIKGTVTGPTGTPISGVTVMAYHLVAGRWRYYDGVATAANGGYDLGRLYGDGYRIRFRHNGYAGEWYVDAEQPGAATTVTVADGATVTGINAQLGVKGTITGQVTDPLGQPLEGMGVWAYRLDDGEFAFASNDYSEADGTYTITGLAAGTYGLEFFDPDDVYAAEYWDNSHSLETGSSFRVEAGQTVTGKNAQLALQGRIEGTVTLPSGAPDGYARAQVFTYEAGVLSLVGTDDTAADGSYSVTGLGAGSYKVYLYDRVGRGDEWWDDTALLEDAATVVVPSGGVVGGIDADLDAYDTPVVTNLTAPSITGAPEQGQTLTANTGTWTPDTATLTYRWLQDGAPINGATGSTLLLDDTMVGSRISVRVFGAQDGFVTTRATSAKTDPVAPDPANLPASVSGQLTALTGLPVSSPTIAVFRQVSGSWTVEATGAGDANGSFSIGGLTPGMKRIRFTKPGYVTEYWQDATTIEAATGVPLAAGQSLTGLDAVVAPVTPPVATASSRPRIQGAEQLGSTLTVLPGTWSPADATLTYQWLRDGAVVAGATSTTYLLAPEDVGHRMSVRETASREHWAPGEATSDQTYVVEGEFFTDTGDPAITGTAQVGQTLTAQPGTWVPAATSFAYQWFSAQAGEIAGATGPTYVIPQSRVNQNLYVLVTGSKPGYRSESRYSGWTGLVTAAPVAPTVPTENTAPPIISGRLQVGARLTATPGVWNNSGLTYTYYWWCGGIRLRSSGPTVGLPADCERQTARVVVGAKRAGESEVQASSADTGVIGKGQLDVVEKPKLVGKAIAGRKLRLSLGEIAPRDAKIRVRWRLDGKPLKVFTRSSIKVLTAYVGHTLTARLVVTRAGYTPLVMTTKGKKVT